jgi:hypothetical protein
MVMNRQVYRRTPLQSISKHLLAEIEETANNLARTDGTIKDSNLVPQDWSIRATLSRGY